MILTVPIFKFFVSDSFGKGCSEELIPVFLKPEVFEAIVSFKHI